MRLGVVQQLVVWLPDDLRLYWLLGEVYNAQGSETDKENRSGIRAAYQIFKDLAIEPATEEAKEQLKRRLGVLSAAVERFNRQDEDDLNKKLKISGSPDTDERWHRPRLAHGRRQLRCRLSARAGGSLAGEGDSTSPAGVAGEAAIASRVIRTHRRRTIDKKEAAPCG